MFLLKNKCNYLSIGLKKLVFHLPKIFASIYSYLSSLFAERAVSRYRLSVLLRRSVGIQGHKSSKNVNSTDYFFADEEKEETRIQSSRKWLTGSLTKAQSILYW